MTIQGLADLSSAIAGVVAGSAALVTAIRVGPNRHVTGLHWSADTVVTLDQTLPAQDGYSLVLASGAMVAGRPGPRDPAANLALIRLDAPVAAPPVTGAGTSPTGGLVLMIGAAFDGSPTARLGMVHARGRGVDPDAPGAVLDISIGPNDSPGAVLDPAGRLLGLAAVAASGDVCLIPRAAIARLAEPGGPPVTGDAPANVVRDRPRDPSAPRRGWLGVALQPITVPEPLVARAGQASGRMVVKLTHGGPADRAGLCAGDVVLALNGYSTSGAHALRDFLGADRIGTQIEVRLLRDGSVLTTYLTVEAQPA